MWWLILVTGTLPQNINHNLGVIPELMIVKAPEIWTLIGWATYNSFWRNPIIMNLFNLQTQFQYEFDSDLE
jgi:hypothetical protein